MQYCICFYLAELLVITTCNICLEVRIKNYLEVLTIFYKIIKYIFGCAEPFVPGALRPGPRGPML